MKEELPECKLWKWFNMTERDFFKDVRKRINTKFRWCGDEKPIFWSPWLYYKQTSGWCTPIACALGYDRQTLVGRLLKNGADVNEPCVGYDDKPFTLRPIEFIRHDTKSAFLVLKRNPSIEFCVGNTGLPFHLAPNLPESIQRYIWQKRMYALCFCLTSMGQSWPDMVWIMKDFLL